jgi:TRAP-type C4-dicarboxylate transport system, small permease component
VTLKFFGPLPWWRPKGGKMKKIIRIYQKIEENFLVVCMLAMGIVLTLQIVLRYLFKSPISWAEEFARYVQIWITFIGVGFGFRKKSHIAMTLVLDKLPGKWKTVFSVFSDFVILACSITTIAYSSAFLAQQNKLSSVMHVPMKLVYCSIPIGMGILCVYVIADISKLIINAKGGIKQC